MVTGPRNVTQRSSTVYNSQYRGLAQLVARCAGGAEVIGSNPVTPTTRRNMQIIDKLAWIHTDNGKILSTRSKGKDAYYIPGGKREVGESDWQTLSREIREELSIDLVEDTLKSAGVYEAQAHGKNEGVIVRMTCYFAEYRGDIKPCSEIEEVRWLGYDEGRSISSPVDQIIFDDLHVQGTLQ